MIKIHTNIIIGNLIDLQNLINNTTFIINCSSNYQKLFEHPHFLNLNLHNPLYDTYSILEQVYFFISSKIVFNQNIFILCDSGISDSLTVGIFFLMKFYNMNYKTVYNNLSLHYKINSYNYYSKLVNFEKHIKLYKNDDMDLS